MNYLLIDHSGVAGTLKPQSGTHWSRVCIIYKFDLVSIQNYHYLAVSSEADFWVISLELRSSHVTFNSLCLGSTD